MGRWRHSLHTDRPTDRFYRNSWADLQMRRSIQSGRVSYNSKISISPCIVHHFTFLLFQGTQKDSNNFLLAINVKDITGARFMKLSPHFDHSASVCDRRNRSIKNRYSKGERTRSFSPNTPDSPPPITVITLCSNERRNDKALLVKTDH